MENVPVMMGAPSGSSSRVVKLSFPCLTCTFCFFPWLFSWAILGIVACVATHEAFVSVPLAELLLLLLSLGLIIPGRGSGETVVCLLLQLWRPDDPSPFSDCWRQSGTSKVELRILTLVPSSSSLPDGL
jgi:hypothetical protein